MATLNDSLNTIQENLVSALKELGNVSKVIKKLESAFMSEVSREAKPSVKRGTASKLVLELIQKSEKGISMDEIKQKTGLEGKTIYGVLNKAKADKKVKSPKRGFYQVIVQK